MTRAPRTALYMLVSAGLHSSLAWLPAAPALPEEPPAARTAAAFELRVERDSTPSRAGRPPVRQPQAPPANPPGVSRRERPTEKGTATASRRSRPKGVPPRARHRERRAEAPAEPPVASAPEHVPSVEQPDTQSQVRSKSVALDPGAAALTVLDPYAPVERSGQEPKAANDTRHGSHAAGELAARRLATPGFLENEREEPPLYELPEPQRREDGSLVYQDPTFVATLRADGSVDFEDKPAIAWAGSGFTFDITAAAERAAGNDPYAARKRRFLEAAQSLREKLRRQYWQDSREKFWGRLQRLRRLDEPASVIREQLFELWLECAPDEVGARARGWIEAFVRREFPAGERLGYSEQELRELNQRRSDGEPFDPYGKGESGAQSVVQ